jgi:hypothetical protein
LVNSGASVKVFEREAGLFAGASAINQNRLHMGFHYPRSYKTRKQIIDGCSQFLQTYPSLVSPIRRNIYAVAERESLLDLETYIHIMEGSKIPFQRTDLSPAQYQNIEGGVLCDEQLLHTNQAREYFGELLSDYLYLSTPVEQIEEQANGAHVNGEFFDYVLNCTWCTEFCDSDIEVFFEPAIMLFYKGQIRDFALTLMDGDFFSIYPFEDDLYTLTAVPYTPLGQVKTSAEAKNRIDRLSGAEVSTIRENMESLTRHYFPHFHNLFEYVGHEVSIKTKIANNTAERTCLVVPNGRTITVFAGKIDTVFVAEQAVKNILSNEDHYSEGVSQIDRLLGDTVALA